MRSYSNYKQAFKSLGAICQTTLFLNDGKKRYSFQNLRDLLSRLVWCESAAAAGRQAQFRALGVLTGQPFGLTCPQRARLRASLS